MPSTAHGTAPTSWSGRPDGGYCASTASNKALGVGAPAGLPEDPELAPACSRPDHRTCGSGFHGPEPPCPNEVTFSPVASAIRSPPDSFRW